jgi:hypothetical protein
MKNKTKFPAAVGDYYKVTPIKILIKPVIMIITAKRTLMTKKK